MWIARRKHLPNERGIKIAIERDSSSVTYQHVIRLWQTDEEFRTFFVEVLRSFPFAAMRWETPPVTKSTIDRPFEFVLLDSPYLAVKADASAFAEHFADTAPGDVISFANLGHDAILVVPCPNESSSNFGHLSAFLRAASKSQQHALWTLVGATMQLRLNEKPVWLSTAGGGVAWLHVRLDDRPKYYGYAPYRTFDGI